MTLQQLYYFQMIARLQHYNKAAVKLHVTQPSLSKAMANLEEELGVALFEKRGRNVVLSKYGAMFLSHVDKIIAEKELAEKELKQLVDETTGHIDIAYVTPTAQSYIPKTVRCFLEEEKNRHVTFSFTQAYTDRMIQGLKNNEFDVVFGSMTEGDDNLEFVPIIKEELVLIVPLKHPLAENETIELSEIEPYPHITYDRHSAMGKYTRKVFKRNNIVLNSVCEASDEAAITALVAEGFGVSYIALTQEVKEAVKKKKIHKIMVDGQEKYRRIYMIYEKEKYQIPAVRNFIEYVKSRL